MTDARFEQCIRRINNGDKDGLREVYEEYVTYIYGIVWQILKNKENVEDVTSDFFIKVWEKSKLYKPGRGHKGWMATIARNMAIDYIRKYGREELTDSFSDMEAKEGLSLEEEVVTEIVVGEALERLSERERTVVHMKVMGDMTFKEISQVLSVPQGTVQWRYREAMKKLWRCGYE